MRNSNIGQIIGIFLSTILVRYSFDYYKQINIRGDLFILIVFIGFVVIVKTLEMLVSNIIERSSFLQKIISGRNYIDGLWIDKAIWNDKLSYGLLFIRQTDIGYSLVVREYDSDLNLLCDSMSTLAKFDGDRLDYLYINRWTTSDRIEEHFGYASMTMLRTKTNKAPKTYTGYFVDVQSHYRKVQINGQKVSDQDIKCFDNIQGTKEKLKQWIEKIL
jgi:hypothetical protein